MSLKENDELLRARDIVGPHGLLKIARSTFYAGIAGGLYPPPLKLGARISVWRRSELLTAVEELARKSSK